MTPSWGRYTRKNWQHPPHSVSRAEIGVAGDRESHKYMSWLSCYEFEWSLWYEKECLALFNSTPDKSLWCFVTVDQTPSPSSNRNNVSANELKTTILCWTRYSPYRFPSKRKTSQWWILCLLIEQVQRRFEAKIPNFHKGENRL